MSELRKFLFEGLPVRGMVVRLTDSWQDLLKRRAQAESGEYPEPVRSLLGGDGRGGGAHAVQYQVQRRAHFAGAG